MAIKCAGCKDYHSTVAEVRACQVQPAEEIDTEAAYERHLETRDWAEQSAFADYEASTGKVSYEEARDEAARTRNFASRESIRKGRQTVPLTERQRSFILSLSAERIKGWTGSAAELAEVDSLSKSDASAQITDLLAMPKLPKLPMASQAPAERAEPASEIPDGHYALASEDGQVRFYSVKAGKNRWEGYTFVKGLIGSPGSWTEVRLGRSEREAIQGRIGADYMAALKLYADKFERCGFCDSPLSDPRSRAARYGETCAGNHGLYYPSKAEAMEILGETG